MKSIVGKILCNRYRIMQQLGQNNWSTLYLAEDLTDNSQSHCHIEQLQPRYNHEVLGQQSWQKVLQSFMAQGSTLKNVSQHPQIPQLLAFFECDREFYLVREEVSGETLEQKLESGFIDESEALSWLQETLRILEFVHAQGMAHLNIKPTSLLQHQDGRKFLTNFGAIKNAVLFELESDDNVLNPDFSPKLPLAKSGEQADLHALGGTIIYALTGSLAEFVAEISEDEAKSPQVTNLSNISTISVTSSLARVLNKMVASTEHCYQSAAEVLEELDYSGNVVTFPPPFIHTAFNSNRFATPASRKKRPRGSFWRLLASLNLVKLILWLLLTTPFIIAAVLLFIGTNKNSYRNFAEYINGDYQFSLKYPENWFESQIDDPITGEIVVFNSPKETETDLFLEKVYIASEYLSSEPTSLEEYSQTVLDRINETAGENIELYEEYKSKIDRYPARTVIYSRQQGSLQLRQMEAFTIKNNRVYIAIYTAERAKFSKFYPTVEKIINSWEIQ